MPLSLLTGALALPFLLGTFFPEPFWGSNAFAFLPPGIGILLVVGAIAGGIGFWRGKWPGEAPNWMQWMPYLLAAGYGLLAYANPLPYDLYGDAPFVRPQTQVQVENWSPVFGSQLAPDLLNPKAAYDHFYGLVNVGSYLFQVEGFTFLRALQGIMAAGLALLWLSTVQARIPGFRGKILWSLLFLGSPLWILFAGHAENYFLAVIVQMGYGLLLWRSFDDFDAGKWAGLMVLLFLAVYTHISGYILIPSFLLVSLWGFAAPLRKSFRAKTIFGFGLLPIVVVGALGYLFVTDSAVGPRAYTTETMIEVIFLPIQSTDPAPLDRYNLLSGFHFLDYFNLAFSWSTGAWLLLLGGLTVFRKHFNWQHRGLLVAGFNFALFLLVFFVLNPLLGMPIDWDLCLIPAAPLLLLVLALGAAQKETAPHRSFAAMALALVVLGSSMLLLHLDAGSSQARFHRLGRWIYKTYYSGASSTLMAPFSAEAPELRAEMLEADVAALRPFAVPGNDPEIAALYTERALLDMPAQMQGPQVRKWLETAMEMAPGYRNAVFQLVQVYFVQGESQKAYDLIPRLVALEYPSADRALRVAVQISLEVGDYPAALAYCQQYLERFPDGRFIREVATLLQQGNVDGARAKFKRR